MSCSFPVRGPVTLFWAFKVAAGLGLAIRVSLHFLGVWPASLSPPPQIVGQAVVLVGAGINFQHYFFLKRSNPNLAAPDFLVARRGLYHWIRHPMYLGDVILMIGLALLAPGPASLLLLVVGVAGVGVQSRIEDAHMARLFGRPFEDWRSRTRLLVPGLY